VVLGLEMQWRVCMFVGREVVGARGGYCDGVVMMWRIGSGRVVSFVKLRLGNRYQEQDQDQDQQTRFTCNGVRLGA
jgi:hypothetical protein